jgi:hypothetical protein
MSIGRTQQVVYLRAIPRNSTPAAARFQDEIKLAKLKGAECDRINRHIERGRDLRVRRCLTYVADEVKHRPLTGCEISIDVAEINFERLGSYCFDEVSVSLQTLFLAAYPFRWGAHHTGRSYPMPNTKEAHREQTPTQSGQGNQGPDKGSPQKTGEQGQQVGKEQKKDVQSGQTAQGEEKKTGTE